MGVSHGPTEVRLPKLGESVTEGMVVRWLVRPGQRVERYQPLCEILTDKVTAEVPAPAAGQVLELRVAEGETVPVETVIAALAPDTGPAEPGPVPPEEAAPSPGAAPQHPGPAAAGGRARPPHPGTGILPQQYDGAGNPLLSPAVRRAAAEQGVDPAALTGTGSGGRVTLRDVLAAAAARSAASPPLTPPAAPPAAPAAGPPGPPPLQPPVRPPAFEEVTPDPIRRQVAAYMERSAREIPHAWTMVEVDATRLVQLRNRLRQEFARREGFDLTYLPFFAKAVVEAATAHPHFNASWHDGKIRIYRRVHLAIAVGLESGLFAPVVHDADQLSLTGLARRIHELVERTRAGRLRLDDVEGGTLTVNNTGSFGSVLSAPIIRPPQGAIVSLEAITRRPVAVGDAIGLRWMVNVCLSFDHRLADGIQAGRFLAEVKRRIESLPEDLSLA